jgi:hypothetical protein
MPHILDSDASQSRNREQSFVAPVMSSMQCIFSLVTRYRATLNSVGNGSTRLKFWAFRLVGNSKHRRGLVNHFDILGFRHGESVPVVGDTI